MPSHYLNQCCNFVTWTFGNKLQCNFIKNSYIFIQENALVWQMAAILSQSQYIDSDRKAILCKPLILPKGRKDQSKHIKGLPTDRCCLASQPEPATHLTSGKKQPPPSLDLYFKLLLRSCIWICKKCLTAFNHSTWNKLDQHLVFDSLHVLVFNNLYLIHYMYI